MPKEMKTVGELEQMISAELAEPSVIINVHPELGWRLGSEGLRTSAIREGGRDARQGDHATAAALV